MAWVGIQIVCLLKFFRHKLKANLEPMNLTYLIREMYPVRVSSSRKNTTGIGFNISLTRLSDFLYNILVPMVSWPMSHYDGAATPLKSNYSKKRNNLETRLVIDISIYFECLYFIIILHKANSLRNTILRYMLNKGS